MEDNNLPVKQDFVLNCVDKMQAIPENLPEKIKTMMIETIESRMQMFLDQEEATNLAASDLLPKEYKNKPANIMLAFKTGRSLGLDRLQSLQHTFTVNGRTRVYGDMMHALSMKHRNYKDIHFEYGPDVETDAKHGKLPEYVKCTVILKERDDVVSLYTIEDAKKNPNFNNSYTPWMNGHARRMMKFRAQSFSLRDAFPDMLAGVYDEYEFEEIQTVNKNITSETTDLGKSGTGGLKGALKEDETIEPSNIEIQNEKGETVKTEDKKEEPVQEEKPQQKPENIQQIKDDFKNWKKNKQISAKEYKAFADTGSSGDWDKLVKMHEHFTENIVIEPIGEWAKKLESLVDSEDFAEARNSLIADKAVKIITSKNAGEVLRTVDEKLAKEICQLLEIRKDQLDSAKKDDGQAY